MKYIILSMGPGSAGPLGVRFLPDTAPLNHWNQTGV